MEAAGENCESVMSRKCETGHLEMFTTYSNITRNTCQNELQDSIYVKLSSIMKINKCSEVQKKSLEFLKKSGIEIKTISPGSIIWTLMFTTIESLEEFRNAYSTGLLKEMLQEDFITKELLEEFNVVSLELEVSVNEEDIISCRNELQAAIDIPGEEKYDQNDEERNARTSHLHRENQAGASLKLKIDVRTNESEVSAASDTKEPEVRAEHGTNHT